MPLATLQSVAGAISGAGGSAVRMLISEARDILVRAGRKFEVLNPPHGGLYRVTPPGGEYDADELRALAEQELRKPTAPAGPARQMMLTL